MHNSVLGKPLVRPVRLEEVLTRSDKILLKWLDEWDRLKGGHLLSLGVALKRASVNGSELSVCSIRGFLLADVLGAWQE